MVKAALVGPDIEAGREFLKALDEARVSVTSALWLQSDDSDDWALLLAIPEVDRRGTRIVYARLQKILERHAGLGLTLAEIRAVSPKDELISRLRRAIRTPVGAYAGVRFTANVIDGVFIRDAFIYRSS